MRRLLLWHARLLAFLLIAGVALWGAGAIWFRLPAGEGLRSALALAFGLLAIAAAGSLFSRRLRAPACLFAGVAAGLMVWWGAIEASNSRDWAVELSRGVSARVEGDRAIVSNVRDFDWRGETDFTPRWDERTYDLRAVRTVDLFNVYWAGPLISHTIVSFGFSDGRQLAFSIEIRREKSELYSPIAGFFKSYELIYIGADERDVIGLRQIRGEDARLFRLRASPAAARALLESYLSEANALGAQPEFYNTLTTNCTTAIFTLLRSLTDRFGYDWRMLANGYLPDYLYEKGVLDTSLPLAELRRLGAVRSRYQIGVESVAFSSAIRDGVPGAGGPVASP